MSKYTIEQERAVLHNEGNILVSASAGSGKTYVMISRIIRLILEKKAKVDDILAVTFTTLAATEMKEKLSKALIEAIIESNDDSLKEQLKLLPTANISTIHSFCSNILRSYFFEADIDANFEILDENDAIYIKNEAINELFEQKYENNDTEFLILTSEFLKFRSDRTLKEIIINSYDKIMSWFDPISILNKSLLVYNEQGFKNILLELIKNQKEKLILLKEDFVKLQEDLKFTDKISDIELNNNMLSFVNEKLATTDFISYYKLNNIQHLGKITALKKNDEEYLRDTHEALKRNKENLSTFLKSEYDFYANFDYDLQFKLFLKSGETSKRLINLITEFIEKYSELKAKENKLDYDDLMHKALQLLNKESILNNIKNQYTYIFADEYQDVNDVQEKLLNLLSDNNLFMVGDLKQSIYAFRGCNMEFFAKKYESYFNGEGRAEKLNANFRSSDGVINGVNKIFNRIMTKQIAGLNYKTDAQLSCGGLYPINEGHTIYHIYNEETKEKTIFKPVIYDILDDLNNCKTTKFDGESKLIAKIIIEEIGKKYYDIKSGTYKEIDFSDIVILSATRKKYENLTNELICSGIPVTSDSKTDILKYPEIRVLINILELIDCCSQDLPLVSVMKSIGNFNENELAEIKLKTNQKNYRDCVSEYLENNSDEIAKKLKILMEYIDKIRTLSDFNSAGEILTKIITENKIDLFYLSQQFGEQKLARIERFLKESKSGDKKLTCKEFLKKINDMTKPLTVSLSGGENTVKLMTIHASKGLEFPVVIVADCGKLFNYTEENNTVLSNNNYGLITKAYDLDNMTENETVLRKLVKSNMRLSLAQNEMRLFYVALTRAKYNLHIVTSNPAKNDLTAYSIKTALRFSEFVQNEEIETKYYNLNDLTDINEEKTAKNIIIGKPNKAMSEAIKQRLYKPYNYLSSIFLPNKSSVSAILKTDDSIYKTTELFGESSAEKGTAYHKFLQYADFDNNISANIQLDTMVNKGIFKQDDLQLLDIEKLNNIINMPVFKTLKGKKLLREQEFLIKIEANRIFDTSCTDLVLIQGVIDLLVIDNDGIEIIDYKLSTIAKEEDIIKKYQKQIYLYRYAAENILNIQSKKLEIINILSESVINIDLIGQI